MIDLVFGVRSQLKMSWGKIGDRCGHSFRKQRLINMSVINFCHSNDCIQKIKYGMGQSCINMILYRHSHCGMVGFIKKFNNLLIISDISL